MNSVKVRFRLIRMFTDLQIMSDFSVVRDACLVTRKNMQAGLSLLKEGLRKKKIPLLYESVFLSGTV